MTGLERKVRKALKKVIDPELGINIVDLGLVYDVREENDKVEVEMTLTSPGCPLAGVIDERVMAATKDLDGVKKVVVVIVWDPPWNEDMISEEAKAELGVD